MCFYLLTAELLGSCTSECHDQHHIHDSSGVALQTREDCLISQPKFPGRVLEARSSSWRGKEEDEEAPVLGTVDWRSVRPDGTGSRQLDLGEALMNNPAMTKEALQALSPEALDALERKIAGKYMHRVPCLHYVGRDGDYVRLHN